MSMDCKTCKGTGHIEFERGAVVKNCPRCKGTGSAKFITLCDALIGPIIKERNEARAERDELRAQVEAMRQALNHILAMQTRGFITLGDNTTSMANDALQAKP